MNWLVLAVAIFLNIGTLIAADLLMVSGRDSFAVRADEPTESVSQLDKVVDSGHVRIVAGIKCDGLSDDAPSFQSALDSLGPTGGAIFIPPSPHGCRLGSLIKYDVKRSGPLTLYGVGSSSRVLLGAPDAGIEIDGSCGADYENVYLRNFSMISSSKTGKPRFAVHLNGVAAFGIDNVEVRATSRGLETGLKLSGAQQGYIRGGFSKGSDVGISLADCGNSVSSNGVDIGSGMSFINRTAAVEIAGGASDVWIHGAHMAGSMYGVIVQQNNGNGGFGPIIVSQNHFETIMTCSINVLGGTVTVTDNGDYTHASVCVRGNSKVIASRNLLNGGVHIEPAASAILFNNLMLGTFDNRASAGHVVQLNNVGPGAPRLSTYFNSGADITSNSTASGDILALRANPTVSGSWGLSVTGAGKNEEVYLKLGGARIVSRTSGNDIEVQSPDRKIWGKVTSKGVVGSPALIATGRAPDVDNGQIAIGATTSSNANEGAAGRLPLRPSGYLIVNIHGEIGKVPYFRN